MRKMLALVLLLGGCHGPTGPRTQVFVYPREGTLHALLTWHGDASQLAVATSWGSPEEVVHHYTPTPGQRSQELTVATAAGFYTGQACVDSTCSTWSAWVPGPDSLIHHLELVSNSGKIPILGDFVVLRNHVCIVAVLRNGQRVLRASGTPCPALPVDPRVAERLRCVTWQVETAVEVRRAEVLDCDRVEARSVDLDPKIVRVGVKGWPGR